MAAIVIFTRLEAKTGRRGELVAALQPVCDQASSEGGTVVFAMHVARDEPNVLLFYEIYRDQQALLEHQAGSAVHGLGTTITELLAAAPVVTYAEALRAKGVIM